MSVTAQSVIQRVVITLQDPTSIRWTVDELVRYFNDGMREIGIYRPDALEITASAIALVAGANQQLPAGGLKLISIPCNGNGGQAIRIVSREILDAQIPSWRSLPSSTVVKHYMYDERDPKNFYVYPPAALGASVDMKYMQSPIEIVQPTPGQIWNNVDNSTVLPVSDLFGNALHDYVIFRCYSKDAIYAANPTKANAAKAAFDAALGLEVKATTEVAPRTTANPDAFPS